MNRRDFIRYSALTLSASQVKGTFAANDQMLSLEKSIIVISPSATAREKKAAAVLAEEAQRRSSLVWAVSADAAFGSGLAIYAVTERSAKDLGRHFGALLESTKNLSAEGFAIRTGSDERGRWIAVIGKDERGLLFGVGKLLRLISFGKESARIFARYLDVFSSPRYPLRGHQLGYRPKTNAYDAWTVPVWDQYIRDMAMFGTNAIELAPPRSDDLADSPHFSLPPNRMMPEMSRIADSYGLSSWIWYPAMDANYKDSRMVELAVKEWASIFESLPRIDAIFVPGGDPGKTAPRYLLALLKQQKQSLNRYHPHAEMWVSPQGFHQEWMDEFFAVVSESDTQQWLNGVVFGPQVRLALPEFRKRLPEHYPIRLYPDITHSTACEFPVSEWDVAYSLTEGREVINPRPLGEANIWRRLAPATIGFITYSEGCNDDVNKFVWSALGWNPDQPVIGILREFSRYFFGDAQCESMAQGLLDLEANWCGPLATNASVAVTLARFQDLERKATPSLLENWRFQQTLYRAYYDAFVRARLLDESARLERARELLSRVQGFGWASLTLDIDDPAPAAPANGLDPGPLLEEAERVLGLAVVEPAGRELRARVLALGEALFGSIRMQLAVERYQAEAVSRAANLDTLDTPVTDVAWLRAQVAAIRQLGHPAKQVKAVLELLRRTDPGPGGFYDELGDPSQRPHLLTGPGSGEDPEFRQSVLTGFDYPDEFGDKAPIAWKRWGETLFSTPLRMRYTGLNAEKQYSVRVVYSGDEPEKRMRLVANNSVEIHGLIPKPWPPVPQQFDIPRQATSDGELTLTWSTEPGNGGNGRGCQVSEVWLLLKE